MAISTIGQNGLAVPLVTSADASISGLTVGKGASAVSTNTAFGVSALTSNTSGANNQAFGSGALSSNTTGGTNSAFAQQSLGSNSTGNSNSAFGYQALVNNTTASNNTAVGYQAGYANTTGTIDAFGSSALGANTTGTRNAAFGIFALQNNTTGVSNISMGRASLATNTTGSYNTAMGDAALNGNTTASNNTAVGYQAGYANTTGVNFTALGAQAGYANTTAANCTYIGTLAGYQATGQGNTFVGSQAGYNVTSGNGNTFIGGGRNGIYPSGYYVSTGSANTIVGNYNGNQGGLDIRTASNYIVLSDGDGNPRMYVKSGDSGYYLNGQSGATQVLQAFSIVNVLKAELFYYASNDRLYVDCGGAGGVYLTNGGTSWTSNSDARLKNVTGTFTNALSDISQLEPVKFTWKSDESNKPCVGLIAQSVEKVLPEAISRGTLPKSDDTTEYLGVSYTDTIPLLVAAIQELNAKVTALEAQLQGK